MARANAARRSMPPESSRGSRASTPSSPTEARRAETLSAISASPISVCSRSGRATFSKIDIESRRAPFWNNIPRRRRARSTSAGLVPLVRSPPTVISPASGRSSPPIRRSSVLFPAPLPPITIEMAPRGKSQLRSRKTSREPKRSRTRLTSTWGSWLPDPFTRDTVAQSRWLPVGSRSLRSRSPAAFHGARAHFPLVPAAGTPAAAVPSLQ